MTKKEIQRRQHQEQSLIDLGFTIDEAEQLRRISNTLQRWYELECGVNGGCVERDEQTNKPYWVTEWGARWTAGKRCRRAIPDRETGARKRLAAIIKARNMRNNVAVREIVADSDNLHLNRRGLSAYIQTDPRGAALYIIRPGDVPEGCDAGAYYSRGTCVY